MHTFTEFLERWRRLEPERCCELDQVRLGEHWIEIIDDGPFDRAIIQAAVQEAIEARNWRWIKEFGNSNVITVYKPEKPLGSVRAFNPSKNGPLAQTLLDAYLQALEAQ